MNSYIALKRCVEDVAPYSVPVALHGNDRPSSKNRLEAFASRRSFSFFFVNLNCVFDAVYRGLVNVHPVLVNALPGRLHHAEHSAYGLHGNA